LVLQDLAGLRDPALQPVTEVGAVERLAGDGRRRRGLDVRLRDRDAEPVHTTDAAALRRVGRRDRLEIGRGVDPEVVGDAPAFQMIPRALGAGGRGQQNEKRREGEP
jgi:hypothetical protein